MHPASWRWVTVEREDERQRAAEATLLIQGGGPLGALRAKLLSGRTFTDEEDATKPRVVVINRALARRYFAGEDPVGKQIGDTGLSPGSIKEIVGVVDDIREGQLDEDVWPAVYYPFNQSGDSSFSLVVRSARTDPSVLLAVAAELRRLDPGLGTLDPALMADRIDRSPSAYLHRSSASLIGGFAAVALLLGAVGLYGVVAYSVGRRTKEIGLRMALGARPSAVYRLVLVETARLVVVGVAAGLAGALAAGAALRPLLFATPAVDPWVLSAAAAVVAAAALLAGYLPARRAASVDPVIVLRAE